MMKKPVQKRMRRRSVRHALVLSTTLLAIPEAALADTVACSASGGSCTIPAGSYTEAFPGQAFNGQPITFVNNGTFNVVTQPTDTFLGAVQSIANGQSGASSSNSTPGSADPGPSISFTNAGMVTHSLPGQLNNPNVANTIYAASIGGNGGNYTNTNAAFSAGSAAAASAASLTNSAAITVNQSTAPVNMLGTLVSGAALLVDSLGGNGGNVTSKGPDTNGNPTYGTQNGTPGAAAGSATLTNSGTVTVSLNQPLVSQGYWGVGARAQGGAGGTGNDGQPGGDGGVASVTNSGNVTLGFIWGGPQTANNALLPTRGAYAVVAASQGGTGIMSVNSGNNGGGGGNAANATVLVDGTARPVSQPVLITLNMVNFGSGTPTPEMAAVAALSHGGNGGAGYDSSTGGFGGVAGTASVTLQGAVQVQATGSYAMGVLASAVGGVGGSTGVAQDNSKGGDGGSTGTANSGVNAAAVSITGATVGTTGFRAPAVVALSLGGRGGLGLDYTQPGGLVQAGGVGGNGGNNGAVRLDITGATITTGGDRSIGILAVTEGGAGGNGGNLKSGEGTSGPGGAGGQSAPIVLNINAGTTITTGGSGSQGVVATSQGGAGGTGGAVNVLLGAGQGNGGAGGGGYDVTVNLAAGSAVTTNGLDGIAVLARSVGGAGGAGALYDSGGGISSSAANGGSGGNSGTVVINSAATIFTQGNGAHGLVAQSVTGTGGSGGEGTGIIYAPAGSGGSSGFTGSATINNSGFIQTAGAGAAGIQAQSIGGNSGSGGGASGGLVTVGGSGSAAANGNFANVTHSGSITTLGQNSIGILAQSIGGGGGNGGASTAGLSAVGGSGGGGGDGDTVTVNLNGSVTTRGQLAHGVVAQSIGGGGGNGGNASDTGAFVALAIGGTGSGGGTGGQVLLNANGGSISTFGSNAIGMVGQSIGGGGGSGGGAYALAGGLGFSAGVAIGGTGGTGGSSSTSPTNGSLPVQAQLDSITISTGLSTRAGTNTNPVDAHGIVLQSLGGGGGVGGSASAAAIAAAIPIPETDTSYSASLTYSMGGKGGAGGAAGNVSLTLGGASSVTTQGQGSHGVLLQSIGGGGGAGGDSSAMATTLSLSQATGRETFALSASVAVGGNSGPGATGGQVTANINGGVITTYGDFANALVAQSIGGGGGNGGVGSTTTQNFGSTGSIGLEIGLGGSAGTGGTGGQVLVNLAAGATLQTYGAGSAGLVAQSIGGGGGTSQGSTVNLGGSADGDDSTTRTAQISVGVGGTGGTGGNAATVVANMAGTIITSGGDSAGVVLQSIGGGGGVGGTAGADASADNPVSPVAKARAAVQNAITGSSTDGYTAAIAVGGTGRAAGQGGAVNYSQTGQITTAGDWSRGVVLQSIGGGGGMGGVATSNSSGSSFAGAMAIGGGGGAAGAGGAVTLQLAPGSVISTGVAGTSGYGAFGILAQSIGGGGGTGVDGSAQSSGNLSLGAGAGRSGGAAGDSGLVSLSGTTTIVTAGQVAPGVVLQSIGGGGGLAARGSTLSGSYDDTDKQTTIQVGGQNGSSGNSGGVSVNASLTIQTAGAHSYGILAQSIGGGGGFAFTENGTTNQPAAAGGGSGTSGNGGPITMTLAGGGIRTAGFGAHGILAQSIGGGGGIAALPGSSAVTLATTGYGQNNGTATAPVGGSGVVTIISGAPIMTQGDFAYGILAQSIAGGGGLVANGSQLYAGVTYNGTPVSGSVESIAQAVNITQSAPIQATGVNSVGIFAQSRGTGFDGPVTVQIQSSVQGGSGPQGLGIWVDSSNTTSSVVIAGSGGLSALSGNALLMTAGSAVNNGTVTGNVSIGNNGTFTNNGQFNPGTTADVGLLVNSANISIASHTAFGVTAVSGAFTQTSSGRLIPDADFAGGRSDVMTVAGAGTLDGRVRPRISSVLPNVELPFLVVGGPVTGQITGDQTAIFGYDVSRKGGTFSVSANADFTPASYSLSRDAAFVANYLQAAWNVGGQGLGTLFATLGNLADAGGEGAYSAALRQISPNSAFAPGARLAAGARAFANAAMSCPQFDGTTSMLVEGECVWAGLTGRTASQASTDGIASFRLNSTTWQAGGQRSMGGGWFLGGSIAYENSRLNTTDGLNSGRGQAGFGAVTGKYQTGPWLFAGAVFGGGGEFNSTRIITLPGFGSVARGSPTLAQVGGALRATYTIGREEFYLRPSMTLSLVHARSGSYRESGAGLLNLDVAAASNTVAGVTPALEVGGRVNLEGGTVLRLFTSAGVSLLSSGSWTQESRLVGAPATAGRFSSQVQTDQVVGRVVAGVQVFATNRLELRLQYDGEYSANLTGHGGSFALAYRF